MVELIVFAAISIFLLMWLKSLLGQQDEDGADMKSQQGEALGQVYQAPKQVFPQQDVPEHALRGEPCSVSDGLKAIKFKMEEFDEAHFKENAKMAFSMILKAFDDGDLGTLKSLLSDDVYHSFKQVINDRSVAGQQATTEIVDFEDVDIAAARLRGDEAEITVRFATTQKFFVKDGSGVVVEGSDTQAEEVVDKWTFRKPVKSSSPVWSLVETSVD